jgi:hypothetical protein
VLGGDAEDALDVADEVAVAAGAALHGHVVHLGAQPGGFKSSKPSETLTKRRSSSSATPLAARRNSHAARLSPGWDTMPGCRYMALHASSRAPPKQDNGLLAHETN